MVGAQSDSKGEAGSRPVQRFGFWLGLALFAALLIAPPPASMNRAVRAHFVAPDDVIVFDETLHGFGGEPSFWREMLSFPLVLVLAHAILTTLVLMWAGMSRFGAARSPPRGILAGKGFLIDNTAELVRFGGHSGHSLRRYFGASLRDVSEVLHAPGGLKRPALIAWLQELGKARRGVWDLAALQKTVDGVVAEGRSKKGYEHRALDAARGIHAWKKEILYGSEPDQGSQ